MTVRPGLVIALALASTGTAFAGSGRIESDVSFNLAAGDAPFKGRVTSERRLASVTAA